MRESRRDKNSYSEWKRKTRLSSKNGSAKSHAPDADHIRTKQYMNRKGNRTPGSYHFAGSHILEHRIFRSFPFAADAKPTIASISISLSIFGTGSQSGAWIVVCRTASHAIRPFQSTHAFAHDSVSLHIPLSFVFLLQNETAGNLFRWSKKNQRKKKTHTQKSDHLPKSTHICTVNASNRKSAH